MTWIAPISVVPGDKLSVDGWNQEIKSNAEAIRGGAFGMSGQGIASFPYASAADQWAVTAAVGAGCIPKNTGSALEYKFVRDLIFPIGTIYFSIDSTSPVTLFGGTWEVFGAGRMIIGVDDLDPDFNAALKTGGAQTVSLVAAENPAHNHTISNPTHTHEQGSFDEQSFSDGDIPDVDSASAGSGIISETKQTGASIASAGSGTAHNNIMPSFVAYTWRRTG